MQTLIRTWLGVPALIFTSVLAAQAPAKQPRDYRVPLNNTIEMWSLLQRMRVPSRLLVWPEENHWILNPENGRVFYKEVEGWLAKWVKPGPA